MNPLGLMTIGASDAGNGKEVAGAWMLMVEVSVQDPAAPSWEFLQVIHAAYDCKVSVYSDPGTCISACSISSTLYTKSC